MIEELRDPYTISTKAGYYSPWLKARRFLGPYKRRLLERFRRKAPPPSPVIGYTDGSKGGLNKRALIAYIAQPFYMKAEELKQGNSNRLQAVEIAKAFNRLGYIVDVVDWLDETFIPTNHYDVLFGMGDNFGRLIPYMGDRTIKIYYATGSYWEFENAAEDARCEGLKARRGIELRLPRRMTANTWTEIADAVIVIGNQRVVSLYTPHNRRVFGIDNSAHLTARPDFDRKNFASARRNFLWFGSTGLLHKGLDLILEVFSELKELDLWVCGPLESQAECDRDLVRAYRQELFHTANIHPIGWISIYSSQFRELTEKCAFVVSASCAEGMSGGILDCIARGVIPMVSRESGIDTDGLGVTFEESSIAEMRRVVTDMANKPPNVCRRLAEEACKQASTRYILENFSRNIERILKTILE